MFKDAHDIVFASSFSSQTVSDEALKTESAEGVNEAEILSGTVDISARRPASPNPSSAKQVVTEIPVKDMRTPITLKMALNKPVEDVEDLKCMYKD